MQQPHDSLRKPLKTHTQPPKQTTKKATKNPKQKPNKKISWFNERPQTPQKATNQNQLSSQQDWRKHIQNPQI